jgi:tRNA A-37 threonylcarbamoyl transferase component Bud32
MHDVGQAIERISMLLAGLFCLGLVFLFVVTVVWTLMLRARHPGRKWLHVPLFGPPVSRPWEHRVPPARRGHCLECATELPPDSPDGLCPQCLLKGGLSSAADHPPEERKRGTTPYPGPFTAPDPAELAVHFPQLEIVELIGQGGMGAVYKARQTKLDRLVALKILPSEWGKDPAFAERFAREARTLARLNHPNIVAVHDFGESGGLYYLVMEYVDGLNLRETMNAGRLSPEEALAVVPQVCDALQYAHEEGVVHRDIKPENILLDRRGRVKIADFGLAKLLNRPRAEFTLTGSRQVMGTADYMAPEQRLRPLEIDHRADIYSLGVVFYEMLTGELPLGRFAPPSQKVGVDARLDEVVLHALETDPEQRYQSISAVKLDVESITGGAAPVVRAVVPAGDGRKDAVLEEALAQVQGPAAGLMLAGFLGPLTWAVPFLFLLICTVVDPLNRLAPRDFFNPRNGEPPPFVFLVVFFISLVPGGILVVGARRMRRCEAYELSVIAAVTALLPITGLIWLLSLPMGLWALLILFKRQVRDGFALKLRRQFPAAPGAREGTASSLRSRVRSRLIAPAVALILTGILQGACQVLLVIPVGVGVLAADYWLLSGGNTPRHAPVGELIVLGIPAFLLVAAWFFFGLYVASTMVRAGVTMLRLGSYRLAVKGSVLAMIPCTLTSLLTIPAGIWAFIVLSDPEVEAAFPPGGKRRILPPPPPARRPTGPVRRKARSFLDSMLAMFITRPGKDRPDPVEEREGERLPGAP